jgi:ketopantoate hydroxymethyltransferase
VILNVLKGITAMIVRNDVSAKQNTAHIAMQTMDRAFALADISANSVKRCAVLVDMGFIAQNTVPVKIMESAHPSMARAPIVMMDGKVINVNCRVTRASTVNSAGIRVSA